MAKSENVLIGAKTWRRLERMLYAHERQFQFPTQPKNGPPPLAGTADIRQGKLDSALFAEYFATVSIWSETDGVWEDTGSDERALCPRTIAGLPAECWVWIQEVDGQWTVISPTALEIRGQTTSLVVPGVHHTFDLDHIVAVTGSKMVESDSDTIEVDNTKLQWEIAAGGYVWAVYNGADGVWEPRQAVCSVS